MNGIFKEPSFSSWGLFIYNILFTSCLLPWRIWGSIALRLNSPLISSDISLSLILLGPTSIETFSQCDQLSQTPAVQTFRWQQRLRRGRVCDLWLASWCKEAQETLVELRRASPLVCKASLENSVQYEDYPPVRESLAVPPLCSGSQGHEAWLLMYTQSWQVQLRVQKTHNNHLNTLRFFWAS